MPINNVPSTPAEEVLLIIGDEDQELITSDVIDYILEANGDDVNVAAVKAVQYIISSLAKRIDEEVGDVKVKFSQLLENYKKLLSDLLTSPALGLSIGLHKFGGVSKAASDAVRDDPDSRGTPLREGFFTQGCGEDCSRDRTSFNDIDCI